MSKSRLPGPPGASHRAGKSGGRLQVQVLHARGGLGPFLRGGLMRAAALAKVRRGLITVVLVNDAEMSRLHQQHMNLATTTDVLTFDWREGKGDPLEADLVLCIDEAARQAKRRGHAVRYELLLYAIHGLLHLLGYDDHSAAAARRMHQQEDRLLQGLGIGPVFDRPVK